MGVMIFLDIMPHHIDESEWAKVYDETLEIINYYPFVDKVFDDESFGCNWSYLTRTQERAIQFANNEVGWHTIGDERTLQLAESFAFIKDLHYYRENLGRAGKDDDILFSLIHEYSNVDESLKRLKVKVARVFDGKTQGEPFHIPLLAIACLIESRFPQYAIVRGDITISQMEKAVNWANTILKNPIALTERANNEKLLKRIKSKVQDEAAVLDALMYFTLHDQDIKLGDLVRIHFKPETIAAYHIRKFNQYTCGTIGFSNALSDYFNQGFLLADACELCVLDPNGCNYDAMEFVKSVLSMAWPMQETNHVDSIPLKINDPNSSEPETVNSLLGKTFLQLAGCKEQVISEMTFQDVAAILQHKLGSLCDIETLVQEVYEEVEESDDILDELYAELGMDKQTGEVERDHYTVMNTADLILWKPGDTIHPNVMKNIDMVNEFVEQMQENHQDFFAEFQEMPEREKMRQLIHSNHYFYIHKKVWDGIIENLDDRHMTSKYLGVLSIKADEMTINRLCKNILNNQELFKAYIL